MSEQRGEGVKNAEALADYVKTVLVEQPKEQQLQLDREADAVAGIEASPDRIA